MTFVLNLTLTCYGYLMKTKSQTVWRHRNFEFEIIWRKRAVILNLILTRYYLKPNIDLVMVT